MFAMKQGMAHLTLLSILKYQHSTQYVKYTVVNMIIKGYIA